MTIDELSLSNDGCRKWKERSGKCLSPPSFLPIGLPPPGYGAQGSLFEDDLRFGRDSIGSFTPRFPFSILEVLRFGDEASLRCRF